MLLTNDGQLTHRLTHPSFGVEKEYLAEVEGDPSRGALRALREGVELDDGLTAPARVSAQGPSLVRIVIHEGRNRQVRRMCEAVGHPVTRLIRTRIGSLRDTQLRPGSWRELTQDELRELERSVLLLDEAATTEAITDEAITDGAITDEASPAAARPDEASPAEASPAEARVDMHPAAVPSRDQADEADEVPEDS